jgi:hypothetical protein
LIAVGTPHACKKLKSAKKHRANVSQYTRDSAVGAEKNRIKKAITLLCTCKDSPMLNSDTLEGVRFASAPSMLSEIIGFS